MAKLHQGMGMSCLTVFPEGKLDNLAQSIKLASTRIPQIQNGTGEGENLREIFEHNSIAAIQEVAENCRTAEAERAALSNEKGFYKLLQDMQDFRLRSLENVAEKCNIISIHPPNC
jgi:hypothetical protein